MKIGQRAYKKYLMLYGIYDFKDFLKFTNS